ncbi:MAG: polyprenyl synthetase family protein [Anaerolineaceae bacterium]|nr:polyprenyl synthetase family protein [Anaerolineaceae bacterium]
MSELQRYLERRVPVIETDLQCFIEKSIPDSQSDLRYMLQYHMGWVGIGAGKAAQGKRIRPILALLCAELCNLSVDQVLPFCTAIELLHNFSLIHDDIEDGDEKRRGRETLWKIWGIPQAINTGDLLFSMAAKSMIRSIGKLPDHVIIAGIDAFHETCSQLTIGQHLDMKFEDMENIAPDLYLEMIGGKTAALLGYCSGIGSILSNADQENRKLHFQFGQALGVAFQIQDDYLGIWGDIKVTGKANRSDLISRKKSFPILCGLAKQGKFYKVWNEMTTINTTDVEKLALLLEEEEIDQLVLAEVKRYTDSATALLKQIAIENNTVSLILKQLVDKLMDRNY